MKLYVERMKAERENLAGKIKRAKKIVEDVPYGMDKTQILLLVEQIKAMEVYLNCIDERMKYEEEKDA
jgi:hypothetical protein